AADLPVAGGQHVLRGRADHHVIAVARRKPQQSVAHGAADQVDLRVGRQCAWHARMMPDYVEGRGAGCGAADGAGVSAGGQATPLRGPLVIPSMRSLTRRASPLRRQSYRVLKLSTRATYSRVSR